VWQDREQTEFFLYHGVISWDDISNTLNSTARYPADLLAAPLLEMEAAWAASAHAQLAVNRARLFRLLSKWNESDNLRWSSSSRDSDAPAGAKRQIFEFGDDQIYITLLDIGSAFREYICPPSARPCVVHGRDAGRAVARLLSAPETGDSISADDALRFLPPTEEQGERLVPAEVLQAATLRGYMTNTSEHRACDVSTMTAR
jgi:hypothetical protein